MPQVLNFGKLVNLGELTPIRVPNYPIFSVDVDTIIDRKIVDRVGRLCTVFEKKNEICAWIRNRVRHFLLYILVHPCSTNGMLTKPPLELGNDD